EAKVFDTTDRAAVKSVVERLFEDYAEGTLSSEMRGWIERAIEWHGESAAEIVADEISPAQICEESVYDLGEFQQWLWETFEFDLVTFWAGDTALLLNAVEMAVEMTVEEVVE